MIYPVNTIKEYFNVYFYYLYNKNKIIKECQNCHKYFLPLNVTTQKYCNNISPQNPNKTCKEIGRNRSYKNNLKTESKLIQYEHERTWQCLYQRKRRAKGKQEKRKHSNALDTYTKKYNLKKIDYQNKKLTEKDFIQWIKEQKL